LNLSQGLRGGDDTRRAGDDPSHVAALSASAAAPPALFGGARSAFNEQIAQCCRHLRCYLFASYFPFPLHGSSPLSGSSWAACESYAQAAGQVLRVNG
jgi:hypothetical protein